MSPLISVIVPIYKVEKYLGRCLDSVLAQSYDNIELVLVDDGSPDNSGKICDDYAARYTAPGRSFKVIHKENGGVSSARNDGLNAATGDYIAFVDSDDYLMDKALFQTAVSTIEGRGLDIYAFLWQYQNPNGEFVVKIEDKAQKDILDREYKTHEFARLLYKGSYFNVSVVSLCNKVYKHEFIRGHNFNLSLPYGEDEAWVSDVYSKPGKVYFAGLFGYAYVQTEASLTTTPFNEKMYGVFETLKERVYAFAHNAFIVRESQRLYLNLYIEYHYKAKTAGIAPYKDKKQYKAYRKALAPALSAKTRLRYALFALSPALYKRVTGIKL